MTRTAHACGLLVGLLLPLLAGLRASAQDVPTPPPAEPASVEPTPAVEAAPAAEPTPAVDTAPAAAPAAAAPTAPAAEDEGESLLPPGEEEMMGAHAVSPEGGVRFRPGKGLEIRSADGAFSITTRLRGQLLYELQGVDASLPSGQDFEHDFHIRRARLAFNGNFFGEDNQYKLELAISPNDLGIGDHRPDEDITIEATPLLDLYFDFTQLRDFSVRVGQYKVPYNRQRVISSGDLQMVDRSIAQSEFNLDRDIGFDFRSGDLGGLDLFKYYAGLYMGRGRDASGFEDFGNAGLMTIVRFEVLPFGIFGDDYKEVDFARTREPRLSLGVSYSYQHESVGLRRVDSNPPEDCVAVDLNGDCVTTATTPGTVDNHNFEADFIFKYAGFSAQSELFWRGGTRNAGLDASGMQVPFVEAPRDGLGWFLQAGYLVPRLPIEVSARYSLIRGIGTEANLVDVANQDDVTSLGDESEVGVGLSYYPGQHAYKLQADYFRIWSDDITGNDGEHVLRVQLQGSI